MNNTPKIIIAHVSKFQAYEFNGENGNGYQPIKKQESNTVTLTKQPPETAPKDIPFLGKFKSYPWVTMCVFNKPENEYVRCDFQLSLYQGEFNDASFENEYEQPKDLEYWYPMPEHNE